jgi:hypothetical protein
VIELAITVIDEDQAPGCNPKLFRQPGLNDDIQVLAVDVADTSRALHELVRLRAK